MELKKANEALDIRNKRITNLESQVGHASDLFAARTTPDDHSESNARVIVEKLQEISLKLEKIQSASTSNNIVINPCHSTHSVPNQQSTFVHSSSQTEHTAEDDGQAAHEVHDVPPHPGQLLDDEDHIAQELDGGGSQPNLSTAQPNL